MSMRSQVLVEHHGVATGKEMTTWQTLRRGVELSPELRKGIWVTVLLAVLSTLGRVLVPFVVQRITDNGLLAELPRAVVGWNRVSAVLDATGSMTFGERSRHPRATCWPSVWPTPTRSRP